MKNDTLFFSWQSDLPSATNRTFIEHALEDAVQAIRNDKSLEVDPVIDRDTLGVPGSPDIVGAVLEKIERAKIFVCDVSIINRRPEPRYVPNPNVLLELGYAMRAVGPQQIIMILNTAFGMVEWLPFDIRSKKVITYCMPEECHDRVPECKRLATDLANEIQNILSNSEPFSSIKRQAWTENGEALAQKGHEALEKGDFDVVKEVFFLLVGLSTNTRHESYLRGQTPIPEATPFPLAMKLLRAVIEKDFGLFISILHRCRTYALINDSPFSALSDYGQMPSKSFGVVTGVLTACCIYDKPTKGFWAEQTIIDTLCNILLSVGFAFLKRGTGLPPPTTQMCYAANGKRTVPADQNQEFLPFIELIYRLAFIPQPLFDHALEYLKYRSCLFENSIIVDAEGGVDQDEIFALVKSWAVVLGFAITRLLVKDERTRDECIRMLVENNETGALAVSEIRECLIAERKALHSGQGTF